MVSSGSGGGFAPYKHSRTQASSNSKLTHHIHQPGTVSTLHAMKQSLTLLITLQDNLLDLQHLANRQKKRKHKDCAGDLGARPEVVLFTLPMFHLCGIITGPPLRKEVWGIGQRGKDNTDFGEHQQSLIRDRGYDFWCVSRDRCYKFISEIGVRHLILHMVGDQWLLMMWTFKIIRHLGP